MDKSVYIFRSKEPGAENTELDECNQCGDEYQDIWNYCDLWLCEPCIENSYDEHFGRRSTCRQYVDKGECQHCEDYATHQEERQRFSQLEQLIS